MELFPAIVQAVSGEDFTVYAYCNDGAVRLVDVKPMISLGGVFEAISNSDTFCACLTVLNDTVAWDISGDRDPSKCIDLDPYTVFEAPIVEDPLQEAG